MEKTIYLCYLRKYRYKYSITRIVKIFTTDIDQENSCDIKIERISDKSKKESVEIKHIGINKLDVKIYLKELHSTTFAPEKLKEKLLAS